MNNIHSNKHPGSQFSITFSLCERDSFTFRSKDLELLGQAVILPRLCHSYWIVINIVADLVVVHGSVDEAGLVVALGIVVVGVVHADVEVAYD